MITFSKTLIIRKLLRVYFYSGTRQISWLSLVLMEIGSTFPASYRQINSDNLLWNVLNHDTRSIQEHFIQTWWLLDESDDANTAYIDIRNIRVYNCKSVITLPIQATSKWWCTISPQMDRKTSMANSLVIKAVFILVLYMQGNIHNFFFSYFCSLCVNESYSLLKWISHIITWANCMFLIHPRYFI